MENEKNNDLTNRKDNNIDLPLDEIITADSTEFSKLTSESNDVTLNNNQIASQENENAKDENASDKAVGEVVSKKKKNSLTDSKINSENNYTSNPHSDVEESDVDELEQTSLDSLIYDKYEAEDTHESAEEKRNYEDFISDYKKKISEMLSKTPKDDSPTEEEQSSDFGTQYSFDEILTGNSDEISATDGNMPFEEEAAIEVPYSLQPTEDTDGEQSFEKTENQEELKTDSEIITDKQTDFTDYTANDNFTDDEEKEYDPEKPRKIDSIFDFVELFVFTLVAVMLLTCFLFRHSVVDGSSMADTLHDKEHLIISDVFYTPKRGDIIVFEDFTIDKKEPLVKRVIAVEGDMIRITDGKVYVNEELITEDYVSSKHPLYKDVGLMTVPAGEVFVMGDNRGDSHDSRDFGTVSVDSILGKVIFRFYPIDKFGKIE